MRSTRENWLRFWLALGVLWLIAAALAVIYRDELASSGDSAIVTVLILPPAVVAGLVAVGIGEAVVFALLVFGFKIATIGQVRTEFTSNVADFRWYGFARDAAGRLVASEAAVAVIGLLLYCAVGAAVWAFV